jgi:hypothetical protein
MGKMTAVEDPYLRKAAEFAEMAEKAKDAQSRVNYSILADCYRRLSTRVATFSASAGDSDIEALARGTVQK